jgi:N-acetylmuramic acid 6-phosphate etherase
LRETERHNPRSVGLDLKTAKEIVRIINSEDRIIPRAIGEVISSIARGAMAIADTIERGGRVFFVGAGTSGRLGILEAAELPATFGVSSDNFKAIMAGGSEAVFSSIEAAEDDERTGVEALESYGFGNKDLLVALSASGRTPFVMGAMRKARKLKAKTVAVVCNPCSPMEERADIAIIIETGSEVVAGSTRMKAGSAQKMVLNILTTTAMTKLGKVHDGYMIGVKPTSEKLRERATTIVAKISGADLEEAKDALDRSGWDLKVAILIIKKRISQEEAKRRLKETGGILRRALEVP